MSTEEVLCIVLTCCYALLFLCSLLQLLRILSAQHDVYSFQCGFLVLALVWSAARAFFFGEWFDLPELLSLLLWWLPFDLQLSTFSLLILFYGSLLHHARWHHGSSKRSAYAATLVVVNVTVPLLTTAWAVTSVLQSRAIDTLESVHHGYMACQLFALFAVFLYHGYRLHSSPWTTHLLASLLRPLFPLPALTLLCLIVFLSRAIFAVLNCVGLYELEIGGDEGGWKAVEPVAFVLLLMWELLPTAAVILFFHHIPSHGRRVWQWRGVCCGPRDDECGSGGRLADGRGVAAGRSGAGGGDGESERSSSPHSASSRLSYNTADELEADLLQSGSSLGSHSFTAAVQPTVQHGHSHSQQPHLAHHAPLHPQSDLLHSFTSPQHAASSSFQYQSPMPLPSNSHLRPPRPSSHHPPPSSSSASSSSSRPQRSMVSSPPSTALPGPSTPAFSSSFSPPLFASPAALSPALSMSPDSSPPPHSAAVASGSSALLPSPDARQTVYDRAAERWRVRRDAGLLGPAQGGSAGLINGAAARSTAASEDEDEYEYRASLDYDI